LRMQGRIAKQPSDISFCVSIANADIAQGRSSCSLEQTHLDQV
jgi:hypothetical protein